MVKLKETINGYNIFEYDAREWRGKEHLNSIEYYGICFMFSEFLKGMGLYEDPIEVVENTSGIREGNEIHIHDDYKFFDTNLVMSYIFTANKTVWVVLYDKENDNWYGEIEIPNF